MTPMARGGGSYGGGVGRERRRFRSRTPAPSPCAGQALLRTGFPRRLRQRFAPVLSPPATGRPAVEEYKNKKITHDRRPVAQSSPSLLLHVVYTVLPYDYHRRARRLLLLIHATTTTATFTTLSRVLHITVRIARVRINTYVCVCVYS